ncbi:type VI secretion system Vgr family protein [Sphingomonas sp.]|uniref:type VI secretion system Vgr family protein n=1 Tax=Sphingomonas sp. TaxID=28214 RepID=UPI0035C83316
MSDQTRQTTMTIDLGDDDVLLERIECREALATPFAITVDVLTALEIDLRPHLGKPCALAVHDEDGEVLRHFHGIVVASEYRGQSRATLHMHRYRLSLAPWTCFLDQNRAMAIFQDQSAVEIIKQVFKDNGISDTDFQLTRTLATRVYCVQYQESDFAFVSRLMEEEGLYYFYRHEADKHVMVLCDAPSAHRSGTPGRLAYNPNAATVFAPDSPARNSRGEYYLSNLNERVSTSANAKVTIRDWDFRSPRAPLSADASDEGQHPGDERELFHYPGNYMIDAMDRGDEEGFGRDRSRHMLAQGRAQRRVFSGDTQASGLACGTKVVVAAHAVDRMNAEYLVIATHHAIAAERYRSIGEAEAQEVPYTVRFEAIPADTPFHAPRVTPRPLVHGFESAIVTGPDGEEIYTDEYGRVKVRFHWDRAGTSGEKTTCWMRVSQTGGLGNIILPRVGHEVLVGFLGGDPDRPIVVGRVFNEDHRPIYDLPANKTRALWRTKRYGSPAAYTDAEALDVENVGANELRFEDKGGHEEVFLHAMRDMNTRVQYDETHHVAHDQTLKIGHCRDETVGKDETVRVGNDRTHEVTHDDTVEIGNDGKLKVGSNRKTEIGQNCTTEVGITSKLTANTSIELIVGQSSIKIDQTGVTIKGPMITIEGQAMVETKSPLTTVKGSGMLTLKGGLTMIN